MAEPTYDLKLNAPTPEQVEGWKRWCEERPPNVRAVAEKFEPWKLYRINQKPDGTGQNVTIYSYEECREEDGTPVVLVKVRVLFEFNHDIAFERTVFGIKPEELVEVTDWDPIDPKLLEPWAVVAFIRNVRGELLTISRKNPDDLGAPGGKIEEGETPEQALVREVKEETDVDIFGDFECVFRTRDRSVGKIVEYYAVDYAEWAGTPKTMEEGRIVRWAKPEEMCRPDTTFGPSLTIIFKMLGYTSEEMREAELAEMKRFLLATKEDDDLTEEEIDKAITSVRNNPALKTAGIGAVEDARALILIARALDPVEYARSRRGKT